MMAQVGRWSGFEVLRSLLFCGPLGLPLCLSLCGAAQGGELPGWVRARPNFAEQASPLEIRNGANPCNPSDPGFGSYAPWRRIAADAEVLMPRDFKLGARGEFNLVFHFHGRDALRKQLVQVLNDTVVVGMDLGIGSAAYANRFNREGAFAELLAFVEDDVAAHTGSPIGVARHLTLSAWSAGYGAVSAILRDASSGPRVAALLLIDALHADYKDGVVKDGVVDEGDLAPFVSFARDSSQGRRFMFLTHSAIAPRSYASTTETANYLVWAVGGRPLQAAEQPRQPGLVPLAEYHHGSFHVVGFAGATAPDHCAQFSAVPGILRRYLEPHQNALSAGNHRVPQRP